MEEKTDHRSFLSIMLCHWDYHTGAGISHGFIKLETYALRMCTESYVL